MKLMISFLCGLMFGIGLIIAGMTDPQKVIGFLDVAGGAWNPALGFVMGSGVLVASLGFKWLSRAQKPLLAEHFPAPSAQIIDRPLLIGAVLFGMGWGLVGLCPGPAITVLSVAGSKGLVFVASMLGAMAMARLFILPWLDR